MDILRVHQDGHKPVNGRADRNGPPADNLLTTTLFTVRAESAQVRLTLPALMARLLSTDELKSFPQVSAEQFGYFWRFTVRTAARALKSANLSVDEARATDFETLEDALKSALMAHTDLTDWLLHQPDLSKPGFLQVPLEMGKSLKDSNYRVEDCSLLTAIIGTKGHERKAAVSRSLPAEHVVYALIEYQSGTIFGGRGNYESQFTGSRSGAGSGTPFMSGRVGASLSRTFFHDVSVLLKRWSHTVDHVGLKGDIWALWREPWNGAVPLLSSKLDPAFIPLARMIRLDAPVGDRYMSVWFRPSDKPRVDDHTGGGVLGDTFAPTITDATKGHRKVRGALEKGYDYLETYNLLFGESGAQRSWSVAELMSAPPEMDGHSVVFEGLALSQGKTLGFHRREVRLPKDFIRRGLAMTQPRADALHGSMLKYTQEAKRILRSSFGVLWKGNPRVRDSDRQKLEAVANELDRRVDSVYIDILLNLSATDEPLDAATLPYRQWLFETVTVEVFPSAVRSVPRSTARAMEALTRAEAYLRGGLRRVLDLPRAPLESKEEAR